MILPLLSIALSQAAEAAHAADSTPGLTIGGSTGVSVVVGLIVKEWLSDLFARRRRGNGRDEEHEAKSVSRDAIVHTKRAVEELKEMQRDEIHVLADMAKTLDRHDEVSRREMQEIKERLASIVARGG